MHVLRQCRVGFGYVQRGIHLAESIFKTRSRLQLFGALMADYIILGGKPQRICSV